MFGNESLPIQGNEFVKTKQNSHPQHHCWTCRDRFANKKLAGKWCTPRLRFAVFTGVGKGILKLSNVSTGFDGIFTSTFQDVQLLIFELQVFIVLIYWCLPKMQRNKTEYCRHPGKKPVSAVKRVKNNIPSAFAFGFTFSSVRTGRAVWWFWVWNGSFPRGFPTNPR